MGDEEYPSCEYFKEILTDGRMMELIEGIMKQYRESEWLRAMRSKKLREEMVNDWIWD